MFGGGQRTNHVHIVGLMVVMQFLAAGALKCVCNPDDCEPVRPDDCPGKGVIMWDPCKCCQVCARTLGESCGGLNGFSGTCEPPLLCLLRPTGELAGTCMDFSPAQQLDCDDPTMLGPGCEIVNNRCRCWKRLHRCRNTTVHQHWSYRNMEECRLNLSMVIKQAYEFDDSISNRIRSTAILNEVDDIEAFKKVDVQVAVYSEIFPLFPYRP